MKRFSTFFLSFLALSLVILPGLGCRGGSQAAQEALRPVTLEYWRVFDNSDSFDEIIAAYQRIHPNVRINYTKLRFEEYEEELLRAFAEDRGPDIFSVHNTAMKGYLSLIEPMPSTTTLTFTELQGLRNEPTTVLREQPTLSLRSLNDQFVQVVPEYAVYPVTTDGGSRNRIHGLPLSVDTLALYYNKDLLDAAGIPTPPRTWEEFQEQVVSLTRYNASGDIAQSAAGFGTGANVERSPDIISLLMMQSGAQMADARGNARFADIPAGSSTRSIPAGDALRFYTDFANPTKESFTWNHSFANSLDAFAAGQTAFFLGYSYHAPIITTRAPKLNYAVTTVPQITQDARAHVNFANFWLETVSKKTEHVDWAWDFVQFAADAENVTGYLESAGRPTALRELILDQQEDFVLAPFANQVLSATAWYNGSDPASMEEALEEMIDNVVKGTLTIEDALGIAEQEVNQSL